MVTILKSIAWLFAKRYGGAFSLAVGSWIIITIWINQWPSETMPLGIAVLFTAMPIIHLVHALAVFTFGGDSDLLSRTSTVPAHLMRLPMSSALMVAYPYVIAASVGLCYWAATCFGVLIPLAEWRDQDWFGPPMVVTPLVWLSTLAWIQAILWSNHRLLIVRNAGLIAAATLPFVWATGWVTPLVPDTWVIAGLLISIPIGVVLTIANVKLARQGHAGGWIDLRFRPDNRKRSTPFATRPQATRTFITRTRDQIEQLLFRNPVRAQAWCDWRSYCLPIAMVISAAMLLFTCLGILLPSARQARVTILFIPPVIGCFTGFGIGGLHERSDESGVSTFLTSLPFTCSQFILAKWMAAFVCAAFSCLTALMLFCVSTIVAGDAFLSETWQWLRQEFPVAQLVFGMLVGLGIYVASTWVLLIQAIPIKLSGRNWLQAFCLVAVAAIASFALVVTSLENSTIFPWAILGFIAVKLSSAIWSLRTLRRLDLVTHESLVSLSQFWLLSITLIIVSAFGFVQPFRPVLIAPVALVVFLFVPVSRLAWAPLTLHWNRHR